MSNRFSVARLAVDVCLAGSRSLRGAGAPPRSLHAYTPALAVVPAGLGRLSESGFRNPIARAGKCV